jgi:hypothetical protein
MALYDTAVVTLAAAAAFKVGFRNRAVQPVPIGTKPVRFLALGTTNPV